jgi:hypothetical protein
LRTGVTASSGCSSRACPAGQPRPRPLVSADELIGNITEVIADDLRLRADPQNVVPDPLDQRRLPAGSHRAKRVPCMARNQTKLRGLNPKLALHMCVSLARRLMVLHAVRAEAPLESENVATSLYPISYHQHAQHNVWRYNSHIRIVT